MNKVYNWCAFAWLLLLCGLTVYSIYAARNDGWKIAPPLYVFLIAAIVIFILGILGFRDKSSRLAKVRSWISTGLSLILIFIFIVSLLFTYIFSDSKQFLTTAQSPDKKYTIDFYSFNAGAMGPFIVFGELRGPLWFTKRIYEEKGLEQVEVIWDSNHELRVNNGKLDLSSGKKLRVP